MDLFDCIYCLDRVLRQSRYPVPHAVLQTTERAISPQRIIHYREIGTLMLGTIPKRRSGAFPWTAS